MATIENFTVKVKTEGATAIKNLSNDVANLGTQFGGLNNTLGSLTSGLGVTAGAVAAVTSAFAALGLRAVNIADQFQDLSDATGISAGELMNLKQSIIAAGGDTESFAKATTKLSVAIGEAMTGNEKYQKSFQQLGVFVTDANGKLRSTSDITQDVISRLADISDPAVRSAKAVELLGKEAAKIDWTQVKAGKDAFTDENIKNLAEFQKRLDQMAATLEKGLINNFGQLAKSVNQFLSEYDVKGFDAFLNRLQVASLRISGFDEQANKLRNQFKQDLKAKAETDVETQKLLKLSQTPGSAAVTRPTTPTAGRYGATPEATLKAIAESQLRITQNTEDAKKEIEIRGAGDIEKINIEMRSNIAKSVAEIQNRERISQEQKAKETLASVSKFTEKAANDIAKVRSQLNIKIYTEEEAQRQKIAEELAQEETRIGNIVAGSLKIVDELANQNKEMADKAKFALDAATMTDQERANAQALFDIEQQRLALLKQIADIKDLPYAERLAKEKEVNDLIAERKNNTIANQEAQAAQQQDFSAGWAKAYRQYVENGNNSFAQAGNTFQTLTRGFEDSMVRFVQTGKLSFKDLFNSLIAEAVRAQSNKLVTTLLGSLFGSFGGNTPFIGGSVLGGTYGGAAIGGPIDGPTLVGERGPEMFIPKGSGMIVPNDKLFGGGETNVTNVTYTIQAVDASSFRSMLARDPEFIHNVAEQGRRQLPIRSRR